MEKMIRIEGVYLPLNSNTLNLLSDIRVYKYGGLKKIVRDRLELPEFQIVEIIDSAIAPPSPDVPPDEPERIDEPDSLA